MAGRGGHDQVLGVPALLPPEVAVGAEEQAPRGGAAEDGPGGAAVGAERRAGVAGADPVGAVHVAVAGEAQPGGVRAAVDRRRRGAALASAPPPPSSASCLLVRAEAAGDEAASLRARLAEADAEAVALWARVERLEREAVVEVPPSATATAPNARCRGGGAGGASSPSSSRRTGGAASGTGTASRSGGSLIEMTGPKRGIPRGACVLMEFDVRIKRGGQGEDDLQLIDGASEFSEFAPCRVITSRINGDYGAVDITEALVYAILFLTDHLSRRMSSDVRLN
ncbi:hypothetical protein EJB05_41991, partial [Eragrostis curvula]